MTSVAQIQSMAALVTRTTGARVDGGGVVGVGQEVTVDAGRATRSGAVTSTAVATASTPARTTRTEAAFVS